MQAIYSFCDGDPDRRTCPGHRSTPDRTIEARMNQPATSSLMPSDGHVQRLSYAERNAPYWRRNLFVCVFGSFTTLLSLRMVLPLLPLDVQQFGVATPS